MAVKIAMIPTDNLGNKLFIKDFRKTKNRVFVKYKSTYNDIPFKETEIYVLVGTQFCAICADDGSILFQFSLNWINQLM